MNDVLISIKPRYVNMIFLSGEKWFEFRRVVPKKWDITSRFYVYASAPVKKIIGWFNAFEIMKYPPSCFSELWEETGELAGISEEELERYFAGAGLLAAIDITRPRRMSPVELAEIGVKRAPQNFIYLTPEQSLKLELEADK